MRNSLRFWGLICIGAGLVFLISNLTGFNAWAICWPLVLITLGGLVLWGALHPQQKQQALAIPLGNAHQAVIKLHYGAGKATLADGAPEGQVLAGEFGDGVISHIHREGDILHIKLTSEDTNVPLQINAIESRQWDVRLTPHVPLILKLKTGACEVAADLENLQVTDLKVNTGASSTIITLPAHAGMTYVNVDGGAASVKLLVPETVAANIRAQGGLSSINIDTDRFPRVGDSFISPTYETAAHKVEINAKIGVGSITIV